MATDTFFDENREQSTVKATIVEKYFDAWAGIIIGVQKAHPSTPQRLAYVDLFAGPGRYRDGAISTPLRVLQRAIAKPDYRDRLITIFNDRDEQHARTLEQAIKELSGIQTLKNPPQVWNEDVGDQIAQQFNAIQTVPILAFIDPWGYKGLTLQLVDAFLKNWGCDCIFFFNYGRINAGLNNPYVRSHMAALFGDARAQALTKRLGGMTPAAREATIVNELAIALKQHGHRYVLPFCFKNASGARTSHNLVLVSKHFKAYEVMKEIMAGASSWDEQGVASFTYSPADSSAQGLLFELNRPLDDLREMLLFHFAGRTLTMRAIYEEHSIDRPFLGKHYKQVLRDLEDAGQVTTTGRKSTRGFADEIRVTFPAR
jgi:three-Cys-motif partner protein